MARTQGGESVLSRVVRIVDAFRPGDTALSVTEIARRSGLHIATASRLVEELTGFGWLQRDDDRKVRIGVKMWEAVSRASPTLSLREAAMPVMEDLHAIVGQHIQLGVMEGDEVLFVERLTVPGAVINYTRRGRPAPTARFVVRVAFAGLCSIDPAGADYQRAA